MKRPLARLLGPVLAVLLALLAAGAAAANPLDGMTFVGPTGEVGKEAFGDERLAFYDGKVYSEDCARWGFGEGAVTLRQEGDRVHFQAETQSQRYGRIVWEGVVTGDRIEAVYTWRKQGWFVEKVRQYWFTGTRQP